MNNFDSLYNTLIMEIDWRKALNTAPGKAISGVGKAAAAAGSLAGKGIGALGQAFGTGGKAIPGTQALQAGVQRGAAAVGAGLQKAGTAASKLAASQVDTARKKSDQEIAKQLGISSTEVPKSGDTTSITLGRFSGKGLGVILPKALLTKPVSYEGGMLYTVPLQGVKAGSSDISSVKILYNPGAKGAAQIFYFDKNNMPIQDTGEIGLPKTAMMKPNPDQRATNWIVTDRQTADPEEFNKSSRNIRPGTTIKRDAIIPIQTYGGKIQQYKVLTDPDTNGDFIALKI